MSKWKIVSKATSFTSLRPNCWNITQVIQKCKSLTNFSRILTCYLIESYLKKVNLLCLRHWCFSGKFRNFLQEQKQQPEVFCKNDVLKDFTISTTQVFSVNIANILITRIMKNIFEEIFLKKLAASVLALLLNANYLLTGSELIGKKINSC